MLKLVDDISNMVDIHYIRQKEPKGLGHAIYCARSFIGDEPFAVLLGDDIVYSKTPCLKQIIEVYNEYKTTVLGCQHVSREDVNKYGIVNGIEIEDKVYKVKELIEKPDVDKAPSTLAILGRYIITPRIFYYLAHTKPGIGGEIQLTDALQSLVSEEAIYAYDFEGKRYDVGNKLGYLQATVEFALRRDDLKAEFGEYLRDFVQGNLLT